MNLSIIILFIVLVLIASRLVFRVKLGIWQIMSGGAVTVLLTGQIEPQVAVRSINLDVMLFLLGVFIIGQALEESGYLAHLSFWIFSRAKTADGLMLLLLFVMGGLSVFLMNDTIAIIGTPVVLHLARRHQLPPRLLLLGLAFAITIGSVTSPIGNPQNLLISVHGNLHNPFEEFFKILGIPTFLSLIVAYACLKFFFIRDFHKLPLIHTQEPIHDKSLANLCKVSLITLVLLVLINIFNMTLQLSHVFKLSYIALFSAMPILVCSPRRFNILRHIDWRTLVFFAAMFVLMKSVWDSELLRTLIVDNPVDLQSIPTILAISLGLSQLISNVPLVALYLPILNQGDVVTSQLIALAAGSTLAGNLFIMGAASNVIIIQKAEMSTGDTLGFLEFTKIGLSLTLVIIPIYWLFI